jgi:hypothetical protein
MAYGIQGSRQFYTTVMKGCTEYVRLVTHKFFNAILFRAVRRAILGILSKINDANFFK